MLDFLRWFSEPTITIEDHKAAMKIVESKAASDLASLKQALDACDADRVKRLKDADDVIASLEATIAGLNSEVENCRSDNARLRATIADAVARLGR